MRSSTSDSERAFARQGIAAFACCVVLLVLPYEVAVRASEQRWGIHPARIAPRHEGTPHVDIFLEDLAAGRRYATVAVGTSRVENGVRPDVMDAALGPTYNLGIGGGSSIATLEFLDSRKIRPARLIVGLSPMDFTQLAVRRGEEAIARRRVAAAADSNELPPTRWARSAFYAVLHGANPERRRNAAQWLDLLRQRGNLLAFLNNGDATGALDLTPSHGYARLSRVADPQVFRSGEGSNLPLEYESGRRELLPRLAQLIQRFRARGTEVVLLRVPTPATVRRSEDAETPFDADMAALIRRCGVSYVDGARLMGASFTKDRAYFADSEHMNDGGATAFSRALAASLTQ